MKPAVLVTGGAGYIGSHICKALAHHGYLPVVFDNLCTGNKEAVKWGPLVVGDIRDRAVLARAFDEYKPVAVMHFAALIRVGDSVKEPALYYDNNVTGSWCLLEEARKNHVKYMVFSSTAAVYGNPQTDTIKEDHPLGPINPYGSTKLAMENMIRDYAAAYSFQYAILRYFNAAGADPDAELGTAYPEDSHIIPLLMQVASGIMPKIKVFGTDYKTPDGTAMRDYIHVSDLAEAHILALKKIMQANESVTLNLGTNSGYSVLQLVEKSRQITGQTILSDLAERRVGDPPVLVANAVQAQKNLNWQPKYSDLDTIVKTAWIWRQKQNDAGRAGAFLTGTLAGDKNQRRL